MTRHTKEAPQQPEEQGKPGSHDARRRQLLRAGVTSSLLLTIASRPAWAKGGKVGICTPSAIASANASGSYDFDGCSISAGWWKNFKHRWPIPETTSFHSKFGAVYYKEKLLYSGMTLGQVIVLNGNKDPVQGTFGFHLVGALLNAITFPPYNGVPGYDFTEQQIIDAYNALSGADDRSFQTLAKTLERANNRFDSHTDKP